MGKITEGAALTQAFGTTGCTRDHRNYGTPVRQVQVHTGPKLMIVSCVMLLVMQWDTNDIFAVPGLTTYRHDVHYRVYGTWKSYQLDVVSLELVVS